MKKRITFAIVAALAALLLPALALANESTDPTVQAAQNANTSLTQCITAMTQGAANADKSIQTVILLQAPEMCRKAVIMPNVRQAPTAGEMIWDGAKFAIQVWAGYKGQALMWNGITTLVNRQADSTDNAVNQGFNTANTGIGTMGNLSQQAFDKIPSPDSVGN